MTAAQDLELSIGTQTTTAVLISSAQQRYNTKCSILYGAGHHGGGAGAGAGAGAGGGGGGGGGAGGAGGGRGGGEAAAATVVLVTSSCRSRSKAEDLDSTWTSLGIFRPSPNPKASEHQTYCTGFSL